MICCAIRGKLGCFPDPAYKPDRRSYPVMPFTAAQAVLQSVFYKPEMTWKVEQIQLLAPIRYGQVMTNEIDDFPTAKTLAAFWRTGIWRFRVDEHRMQRRSFVLVEPAFGIVAKAVVKPGVDALPIKYEAQFERRLRCGGFWKDTFMGVREFQADVGPLDQVPLDVTMDLGPMLFDIDYSVSPVEYSMKPARLNHGILEIGDAA